MLASFMDGTNMAISSFDQKKDDEVYYIVRKQSRRKDFLTLNKAVFC